MNCNDSFNVSPADWSSDKLALTHVRREVFVKEQFVPEDLEMDGKDPLCDHVKAQLADGTVIGTGRLLPDGRIGRMAVLKSWRGEGVGLAMLEALLDIAQQRNLPHIHLHAQCSAIGFYEKLGFTAEGEVFLDAGIEHRHMRFESNFRHQ